MKIHLCQIDTIVGAFKINADKVISILKKNVGDNKQLFVFPELTITGYPLLDLVDLDTFVNEQLDVLKYLLEQTKEISSLFVVGYVKKNYGLGKSLYNSAAVCYKGEIIFDYNKRLLPTYDVFDEARYFEPGKEMGLFQFEGERIGIVICEDLWSEFGDRKLYAVNPIKELFDANVEYIISINGSPSVVGKHQEKIKMIKAISKKYAMPIIYVNQVGGNDDVIFDGNSFITDKRGLIIHKLDKFKEKISCIERCDLDFYFHTHTAFREGLEHSSFSSDAQFFYEQAVCGVRSYIKKCGFKCVCIGESGGIDSAVVSAIAVDAIGADKVFCFTMPSEYSSIGSYEDSEILCKNLGINNFYTFPIKEYFNCIVNGINTNLGFPEKPGIMEENLQARIRGMILMAMSNRFDYLVLSTGNKSELSVGYCTIYGDMCGGLSPISGIYKMEVYALARYYNELHGGEIIPNAIIEKCPSAELALNQKDTDNLPPYPILDSMLKLFIEGDLMSSEEREIHFKVVKDNSNYAKKVCSLIKKSEFKRRQMPIGIKMHKKDFGFGRRVPIAQSWDFLNHLNLF